MNIKGVVFDWAGTIVDFGALAPMGALVSLFAQQGVEISVAQARLPMGLPQLEHIRQLGHKPEVAQAWQQRHGRPFGEADAQALLLKFEPMGAVAALKRSDFIPGFMDTLAWLQGKGIRVAVTTGYTRRVMAPVIAKARALGFEPDAVVCCDEVPRSRPDPVGMYASMEAMGLTGQNDRVLKVDSTAPGLAEGRHAGCWAVGVSASGNALGWSLEQWQKNTFEARREAISRATAHLLDAGAHEVIHSVADLPEMIERLSQGLQAGRRP